MSKGQSGSSIVILLVVVIIILVGGGAYYLGIRNAQPVVETPDSSLKMSGVQTDTDSSIPAQSPEVPVAVNDPYSEIPAGWTREQSEGCTASIPLPPKQDPYYIDPGKSANYGVDAGSWWHLKNQPYSNPQDKFFTNETLVTFQKPDQNNDYIAGLVQIICGPNTKNYTTQTFVDAYSAQYTDGTFGDLSFSKIGEMPMWGRMVTIALIQGGMYDNNSEFYFATPQKIYRIRKISNSTNDFIEKTTERIFNNLQFVN